MRQILRAASLLLLDTRILRGSLDGRGCLPPVLERVLAPRHQVVHVLEQLVPGHHAWRAVWLHELRALRALRVGAHLLAHVLADARELVLQLRAMRQVLRAASLLLLDT